MIPYAVNDIINPAKLEDVKMGGYPALKAKEFFDRRILSEYGRKEVFGEAEKAFYERIDDMTGVGYWRGEFWGKLAISAVRVCRYLGDDELKEFIRESARKVMASQDEDGYIGTYRNADFVLSPDVNETEKLVGWKCNWCWNIWCRKYTLWGLLECYELLGDAEILDSARRMADHIMGQLDRLGLELRETGTFNGLPSGSIMKPMLVLYRHTEDEKYLDFCINIAENWDREDNAIPNLIGNARTGKPIHEWYPNSELWAKAYEMMSCLDGLVELYRVIGTQKYLDAVVQIQKLLEENELNTVFSVGYNDIFAHASAEQNAITEPCDVIHWMRVNYELFKLSGDVKYMDHFERAYLNPFLAASFRDGEWGARCVRTSGRQMIARQCTYEHNHCCVDNMPRGYMNAAEAAVMSFEGGIYVNLFTEHDASVVLSDGSSVQLTIRGDYARESAAVIAIEGVAGEGYVLRVRIPGWSAKNSVKAYGEEYTAEAGTYLELPLKNGEVELNFDAGAYLVEYHGDVEKLPEDDWRVRRWCNHTTDPFGALGAVPEEYMTWEKRCFVMKGPLMLARSKRVGETEETMFGGKPVKAADSAITLKAFDNDRVWTAWEAEITTPDGRQKALLCDYASCADNILEDPAFFSIWM